MEYEFTLLTAPHHGYLTFLHVDAYLRAAEVTRFTASSEGCPAGVALHMAMDERVNYEVASVAPAAFQAVLQAWQELSKQTIAEIHSTRGTPAFGGTCFCLRVKDGITSEFTWIALSQDETPFDRLVERLREL